MRAIHLCSFVQGCYTVKSESGKQTAIFEDSDVFGPSFVNMRTGIPSPIPDKHWFWKFYQPWREAGRPHDPKPMSTPCGPLYKATRVNDD